MRAVSTEFRRTMAERRNFVNYADMTLSNGEVLHLVPKDFRLSGNSIEDDIVDGDNFSVGTALGKTVTIVLDNTDERFSLYDFYGAYFFLYVALPLPTELEPNRVEKVRIGLFTVITPATTGTLITIEGVDNMYLFDKPYSDVSTVYPSKLQDIVADICTTCGVIDNTGHFPHYNDFVVPARPEGDFTCRQILSYVAQIACCYAKINENGALKFSWFEDITEESQKDGGNFSRAGEAGTPYITGDSLDGGTFNYNDGDTYDGGRFTDVSDIHNFGGSAKGVKVGTDDIVITGVSVKNGEEESHKTARTLNRFDINTNYSIGDVVSYLKDGEDTLYRFLENHTAGTAWDADSVIEILDYEIAVNDNPLTVGQESEVASTLYTTLFNLRFRPFSLSYLQDPTIESGDWVIVEDIKHNTYLSFVTNIKFSTMGYMSVSCNAQPPSRISSTYSSQAASAIVQQNRLTQKQISYYDQAVQRFNSLMSNAMGCYTAEKVNIDGSRYYYMSNKPIEVHDGEPYFTLHSKVWKISGNGFALCQDAGPTDEYCVWTSGWDDDGNAVVNVLSAIGITFDWAKGGTLKLGGVANGNGLCEVYDENGDIVVRITNNGITIYRGLIQSPDYLENSPVNKYSQSGMMIDVVNKIMKSPYFGIDEEGAYFRGTIEIRGDIELGTNTFEFKPYDYRLATDFELSFKAQDGFVGTSTVNVEHHYFLYDSVNHTWNESPSSPITDTFTLTNDEPQDSGVYYSHDIGVNGYDYLKIIVTSQSTVTTKIKDAILAKVDNEGFHGRLEGIFEGHLNSDSGRINGFNYTKINASTIYGSYDGLYKSDDGYEFSMKDGFKWPDGSELKKSVNGAVIIKGSNSSIHIQDEQSNFKMSMGSVNGVPEILRAVSGQTYIDERVLWRHDIEYSDTDLTPGISPLAEGKVYLVYE